MSHPALRPSHLLLATVLAAAAWPALASSSAASSAAEGSSASIGSVSDSFKSSSNSSTTKTAQGDYRVTDVAAADDKPGMLRLTLAPVDGDAQREPLQLTLPQAAVERGRLARGEVVTAQPRAYGVAFARQDEPQQAFFLVLEDAWYRELPAHPVVL